MSGVSSLGQNCFFEGTYVADAITFLVDAFAAYDVLYT